MYTEAILGLLLSIQIFPKVIINSHAPFSINFFLLSPSFVEMKREQTRTHTHTFTITRTTVTVIFIGSVYKYAHTSKPVLIYKTAHEVYTKRKKNHHNILIYAYWCVIKITFSHHQYI